MSPWFLVLVFVVGGAIDQGVHSLSIPMASIEACRAAGEVATKNLDNLKNAVCLKTG